MYQHVGSCYILIFYLSLYKIIKNPLASGIACDAASCAILGVKEVKSYIEIHDRRDCKALWSDGQNGAVL